MTSLARKLYSPIVFDCVFAAIGILASIGVYLATGHAVPQIAAAETPLGKVLALFGVFAAAILFITQTTRLDQKCADDFTFHTLTKSAFMALLAYVIGVVFWQSFIADSLGRFSVHTGLGLLIATWSLTYFWVRLRGTGA